ncbi:hypothetical protein [Dentiradicibacter hellwigii]|uniref:Uncharacterized protein n=1 Tax=Dentiradicibacter hellwigii TaxID=3149053 RepID=A0ABV4UD70_9RHOO
MNLAITGASGHSGGIVAPHLSARGLPPSLPLRNPAGWNNLWTFIHNRLGNSR